MLPWVGQRFLAIALLMLVNPCACEAPVCNNDARCETSAAHNDFPDDASIDGVHMSLLQESLRVASSKDLIAPASLASGSSASGSSASGSSASGSSASGSSSGLSSSKVHSDDGQDSSPKKQGKKSDASTGKEEAHSQRRRRKEENKEKKKSKGKEKTKDASKGKKRSAVAPAIRVTLGNKKKSTYELSWVGLGCFLVILGILFGCLCWPYCTAGAGWWCFPSRIYEEHSPAKWGTQQVRTIATPPTMQRSLPVSTVSLGEQANWDMQSKDDGRRTLSAGFAARSSSPTMMINTSRSLGSGKLRGGTQGLDVGYARPGGGAQQLFGGSQSAGTFVGSF